VVQVDARGLARIADDTDECLYVVSALHGAFVEQIRRSVSVAELERKTTVECEHPMARVPFLVTRTNFGFGRLDCGVSVLDLPREIGTASRLRVVSVTLSPDNGPFRSLSPVGFAGLLRDGQTETIGNSWRTIVIGL